MGTIITGSADKNRIRNLQMANMVSQNIINKDASTTANPSKQRIYNELNISLKKLCGLSDCFNFMNATTSVIGYDYTVAGSGENWDYDYYSAYFTDGCSSASQTDSTMWRSQGFVWSGEEKYLDTVTMLFSSYNPVDPSAGTLQMFICADLNGSPDKNNKIQYSQVIPMDGVVQSMQTGVSLTFSLLPAIELTKGATYHIVLENKGINNDSGLYSYEVVPVGITAPTGPVPAGYPVWADLSIGPLSKYGNSWGINNSIVQETVLKHIWFEYTTVGREYKSVLEMPSDVAAIQTISSANYVLQEYPYDKYQQGITQNNNLGSSFFTVRGYNSNQQREVIVPASNKVSTWTVAYKRKPDTFVEDGDEIIFPSEHRYLIVLDATIRLHMAGYGSQDAVYIKELKEDLATGIKSLIVDYQPKGEQYVNIIGAEYFDDSDSGIHQPNDNYQGFQKIGI